LERGLNGGLLAAGWTAAAVEGAAIKSDLDAALRTFPATCPLLHALRSFTDD